MGQIGQRVESDTSPSIVLIVIVVNFDIGIFGNEVEEPEKEDPKPSKPQGNALPNMSLELNHIMCTFPVVEVLA